jgi:hypothetical protein
VRGQGIGVRIARQGIESGQELGRHRWVTERSIAWLFGFDRPAIRCDRCADHFCAFRTLAASLACFRELTNAAT